MPKLVKCPRNGCEIDHFDMIPDGGQEGTEVRHCPTCQGIITDEEMPTLEEVPTQVAADPTTGSTE